MLIAKRFESNEKYQNNALLSKLVGTFQKKSFTLVTDEIQFFEFFDATQF